MSNHVHLIVVPHADNSLARLVRRVHSSYAQDFNRRRSRDGHLWRSRFYSCPLGPSPLDAALLYVDLNPVRAAMTGTATAWEWSSARAHVCGYDESGLLSPGGLAQLGGCADWEQRLGRGQAETAERALRLATRTGAPLERSETVPLGGNCPPRPSPSAPFRRQGTAAVAAAGSEWAQRRVATCAIWGGPSPY